MRYQINQVIVKLGSTSSPGTSSTRETNPIQLKKKTQNAIPARSRKSPTTGAMSIGNAYSATSRPMHAKRVTNSSQFNRVSQGADRVFTVKAVTRSMMGTGV